MDNSQPCIRQNLGGSTLLEKLRAEFSKSRSRRSNDNALAESKNGPVVRKHLGDSHIPGRFA